MTSDLQEELHVERAANDEQIARFEEKLESRERAQQGLENDLQVVLIS